MKMEKIKPVETVPRTWGVGEMKTDGEDEFKYNKL
jgi:hypothetical protein